MQVLMLTLLVAYQCGEDDLSAVMPCNFVNEARSS